MSITVCSTISSNRTCSSACTEPISNTLMTVTVINTHCPPITKFLLHKVSEILIYGKTSVGIDLKNWRGSIGLCSVLRPLKHSIGYMGDGFYRSKDPTNSIEVLKEATGGSAAEMFEILPRDWNLKQIFTQKWVSVDMNWGGGSTPQPPDNSNPG